MKEHVFDARLTVVIRVKGAKTELEARRKIMEAIDCIDLNWSQGGVTITEATVNAGTLARAEDVEEDEEEAHAGSA